MDSTKKNVAVLAVCQGLLLVNNSVLITIGWPWAGAPRAQQVRDC